MAPRRETATVALLCAGWYACSSASNVVGKLALTRLARPLTLALAQLAGAVLLSPAALAATGAPARAFPARYTARVLAPLALAKVLTAICSQVSIWKVPISYAHTVKATTPLWTAALAWALFGERVSRRVAAALAAIAAGVALASFTELQFSGAGLGAALAAAALLALQHLYSKRVLRDTGAHPLRLLLALSRLAAAMLLPAWAWADGAALLAAPPDAGTAALLAADAALAWLQAVLALSVLARLSPLGYAVASAAKRAAVVAASLAVLRNPTPPANVAGMALAAAGVLAYNRARVADRAARRPALPV